MFLAEMIHFGFFLLKQNTKTQNVRMKVESSNGLTHTWKLNEKNLKCSPVGTLAERGEREREREREIEREGGGERENQFTGLYM